MPQSLLLTAVLCFSCIALPLAAAEGSSPMAAYAAASLGEAKAAGGVQIHVGSITFDLASGSVAPVLVDGHRSGLFFSGTGHYAYVSKDPIESSLVLFEAKKLGRDAKKESDGTIRIRGDFERLYLRAEHVELPDISGGAAAEAGPLQDAFVRHRANYTNARWTPPSHLIARQRRDNPEVPVAVAEISGAGDNGYVLDTVETQEESFYALITDATLSARYPPLRSALYAIKISGQPVGHERAAFVQPRYLLTSVDYVLTAENETARLSVTETVVPRTSAQSVFRFELLSGVWDTDGDYRKVLVQAVQDEAGNKLPFHFEHNSPLVFLPLRVAANDAVKLRFEISGDVLYRPGGDSFWQLGTEAWFPEPDLNGQFYTLHSIVKVKKPWLAFAPGDGQRREEGDYNVLESSLTKPVQFAVVHAGKYALGEEKHDELTIHVASYAGNNDRAMAKLGRLAYKIIKFYEPFLGPFPFKEFNIIEMNALGYGQAPPQTMFITKEAFQPLLLEENRMYSKGINQRFAHEIAHQWWGTVVKMGSQEEQWLTEAFAEYCSALVEQEIYGKNGYDALVARWRVNANDAGSIAPIALANRIIIPHDRMTAFLKREGLLYAKGAYLLLVLREQMGDQKFFMLLRNLQALFAWRFLTTSDVAQLAERIDQGKDYHAFFNRYFWGTEMPQAAK